MVLCPVCNKENNDEEYCTDCGAKLVDVKEDPIFEFDDNKDISNVNELNIYIKELNEKINQQKKFLDELNEDPLVKKYETISKINDENNELRTKIEKLEENEKKISSDLKRQKRLNSQLKSDIDDLNNGNTVGGVIKRIFGNNRREGNFCPHCGRKLS